jgi:hypothetical protein
VGGQVMRLRLCSYRNDVEFFEGYGARSEDQPHLTNCLRSMHPCDLRGRWIIEGLIHEIVCEAPWEHRRAGDHGSRVGSLSRYNFLYQ